MSGNRKHGFMRGSAAGRNGVGTPKGFYCDACEKEHGANVERTGLKHFLGSDVLICDRKYFSMKDAEFKAQSNKSKAIAKLKRLKSKIGLSGGKGLKARVDFLVAVFTHKLKAELNSYQLFDEHNLGERDFDTCLEMHDGDLVVHGLIKASTKNYWLKFNLKRQLGVECYGHWLDVYYRTERLNHINEPSNASCGQLAFTI